MCRYSSGAVAGAPRQVSFHSGDGSARRVLDSMSTGSISHLYRLLSPAETSAVPVNFCGRNSIMHQHQFQRARAMWYQESPRRRTRVGGPAGRAVASRWQLYARLQLPACAVTAGAVADVIAAGQMSFGDMTRGAGVLFPQSGGADGGAAGNAAEVWLCASRLPERESSLDAGKLTRSPRGWNRSRRMDVQCRDEGGSRCGPNHHGPKDSSFRSPAGCRRLPRPQLESV